MFNFRSHIRQDCVVKLLIMNTMSAFRLCIYAPVLPSFGGRRTIVQDSVSSSTFNTVNHFCFANRAQETSYKKSLAKVLLLFPGRRP